MRRNIKIGCDEFYYDCVVDGGRRYRYRNVSPTIGGTDLLLLTKREIEEYELDNFVQMDLPLEFIQ